MAERVCYLPPRIGSAPLYRLTKNLPTAWDVLKRAFSVLPPSFAQGGLSARGGAKAPTFSELKTFPEAVRLIIWDLDETFWNGTLTEGGITLRPDTRELVITLAQRGIMSSICSKNDPEPVKKILTQEGIWDYFIFPSINWHPKGPRLTALIEATQLRPASILFIDDNPANLEEARFFNPQLQTAGHEFIPAIADHPAFRGKNDKNLERLKQYKGLERRQADAAAAGSHVEDFLRSSEIRVTIEHDVAPHLDRVIELINRTNQLNFTKSRLPEDSITARAELLKMLSAHDVQVGLIHVIDRYGDHGFTGFYAVRSADHRLLHFCFSCRILGMGVEAWLYQKLGRPDLDIIGEVLSDPRDPMNVSWINTPSGQEGRREQQDSPLFDWVIARGGCDLAALSHYFGLVAKEVTTEFNASRSGFDPRIDHSMFLRYAIEGLSSEQLQEMSLIGYRAEDFQSAVLSPPANGKGLLLLSFWTDSLYALYRHKRLGFLLPWAFPFCPDPDRDARSKSILGLSDYYQKGWVPAAFERLQTDYDYVGPIDDASFQENMRVILRRIAPHTPVILFRRSEYFDDPASGVRHVSERACAYNLCLENVAREFPFVQIFDIRSFVCDQSEIVDWLHYDRIVYHRLFEGIISHFAEKRTAEALSSARNEASCPIQ